MVNYNYSQTLQCLMKKQKEKKRGHNKLDEPLHLIHIFFLKDYTQLYFGGDHIHKFNKLYNYNLLMSIHTSLCILLVADSASVALKRR